MNGDSNGDSGPGLPLLMAAQFGKLDQAQQKYISLKKGDVVDVSLGLGPPLRNNAPLRHASRVVTRSLLCCAVLSCAGCR
jgi:hypothetical protein